MRRLLMFLTLVAVLASNLARAQNNSGGRYAEQVKAIQSRPDVAAAFDYVEKNRAGILREWTALTEINAPSGREKQRAAYIEKLLRKY
ncbi:MAG TPA: hypothetical protein VF507_03275, partial [Pyrinomonadaceae bacterium]